MPVINNPHDYQEQAIQESFKAWDEGHDTICLVAPTGAGKTIIKAFTVKYWLARNPGKIAVVFAHRDVLLTQISLAFASVGLPHRMICSTTTQRVIGNIHMDELGESWLNDRSSVIIASVGTWNNRDTSKLSELCGLWLMDEYHHTLRENMWGKALEPLQHCFGMGVTATPLRGDKKGLGRHAHGHADTIIETPGMGELIRRGRLSPYRVYTIPERFDTKGIDVTASGELNQRQLATRSNKVLKEIIGDAVKHYKRLAYGEQGIIFADSIKHADEVAADFRAQGINAVALSSKTDTTTRQREIAKFRRGETTLLVNYDLFGEGFDVPAVKVVIMLRKTLSYGLFKQMFGRCLRVFKGKDFGILIDHVGNVPHFLSTYLAGKRLHDDPEWTLDDGKDFSKQSVDNNIITRACVKCRARYEPARNHPSAFICPYCGHAETRHETNEEEKRQLDKEGVLIEYDTSYLDEIIAERARVDSSPDKLRKRMTYAKAPRVAVAGAVQRHAERQLHQVELRTWIVKWCEDLGNSMGYDITTTQAMFQKTFGVNIFKAQVLGSTDAKVLIEKIKLSMYEKLFA